MDRSKLGAATASPGVGPVRGWRRSSRKAKASVVAVVVVFSLLAADWVAAKDPRIRECQLDPSSKVIDSFDMAAASEYRTHFPAAPDLPEFDGVSTSAFVVVFGGPVTIRGMTSSQGSTSKPKKTNWDYNGAVCIVVDHVPNLYPELNVEGYKT